MVGGVGRFSPYLFTSESVLIGLLTLTSMILQTHPTQLQERLTSASTVPRVRTDIRRCTKPCLLIDIKTAARMCLITLGEYREVLNFDSLLPST